MAIFLHGSILHIFFNMWVLMDIGPQIEELYGSARYFFIYVVTGIGGYVLSSTTGHMSVGGSGALLGLIGVLLAVTTSRKSAGMQMLRNQMIRWLIYIAVWGLLFPGIDNFAHAGGLISGFLAGENHGGPGASISGGTEAGVCARLGRSAGRRSQHRADDSGQRAGQRACPGQLGLLPGLQLARDNDAVVQSGKNH